MRSTSKQTHLISHADCIKDRLAAYYHWGDRQALAQAIMVLQEKRVDLSDIAEWSQEEGKIAEFKEIEPLLKEAKAS